jgi:hypothetical protein
MVATCCALRIESELELALVGYAVKSAKNVERALVAEPLRVLLEGVRVPAIARHGLGDVRDMLERTTCGNYELSLLRLFDLLLAYSPRRRFAAAHLYLQAAYQVDLRNPWGEIAREIRRAVPYEMLERRACCWLERRYTERDEPLYGDETYWAPNDARRNHGMGNAP